MGLASLEMSATLISTMLSCNKKESDASRRGSEGWQAPRMSSSPGEQRSTAPEKAQQLPAIAALRKAVKARTEVGRVAAAAAAGGSSPGGRAGGGLGTLPLQTNTSLKTLSRQHERVPSPPPLPSAGPAPYRAALLLTAPPQLVAGRVQKGWRAPGPSGVVAQQRRAALLGAAQRTHEDRPIDREDQRRDGGPIDSAPPAVIVVPLDL